MSEQALGDELWDIAGGAEDHALPAAPFAQGGQLTRESYCAGFQNPPGWLRQPFQKGQDAVVGKMPLPGPVKAGVKQGLNWLAPWNRSKDPLGICPIDPE